MTKIIPGIILIFLAVSSVFGQSSGDFGRFSGNFQIDAQYYNEDQAIQAETPDEELMSKSWLYLTYNLGNFEAGMRYEAYLNPTLDLDPRYEGQGIPFLYVSYKSDLIDITGGDFYEQFGSGLIFRAYEERLIGLDNAVNGARVKLRPTDGIELTGLIGKQRQYWDMGEGIIRGGDVSVDITSIFNGILPPTYWLELGGSVVSKYEDSASTYYKLPPNTLAWSGRMTLAGSFFTLDAEYAYKNNDPHTANLYNYNPGRGFMTNASFYGKGFGAIINAHWIDNMDFRSQRTATVNDLFINFIPPLTKQHAYSLATIYPFATQFGGEGGIQTEITYKIPKNTLLGGDYGTSVKANFSMIKSIDTTQTLIDTVRGQALEYDAPFFGIGDKTYFRDFNIEISRRWSDKLKTLFTFMNFKYNRDVVEKQGIPEYGFVNGSVAIAEIRYRISSDHTIRTELQHMWSDQDSAYHAPDFTYGNWGVFLVEYTIAPHWYISFWDELNYFDTKDKEGHQVDRALHYLNASVAYVEGSTRVQLGFGRQRKGILCVGGICRQVPASSGMFLSISSSF